MNQTAKAISSQRNYGLDLLRLVASFYVVSVHTTGMGGIIDATVPYSYQNYVCRLITVFCFCAINIFGFIAGYVGYREGEKKAPFSGALTLWLTTVFYSLLYVGILHIALPGSVTSQDLLTAFFPVTKNMYWYFSAYVVVYFLSPFINRVLYHSSEKDLKRLFVLCCVIILIEYIGDAFRMCNGYSIAWITMLYLMGGIMKKTGICSKIPSFAALLGIFLINFVYFLLGINADVCTVSIFTFNFAADYSMVSPFHVANAILHVVLFSRLKFNTLVKKIISFAAPATFAIYIVNTNKLIWMHFMQRSFVKNYLSSWAHSSPLGILAKITLSSLVFIIAVVILDYFRQQLFRLLGIRNWPQKLSGFFKKAKAS